jgi:hypothetical protein
MTVAERSHAPSPNIATLDPYQFMAVIGKRVIHPGGRTCFAVWRSCVV